MKIFSAAQTKSLDHYTINHEPIPSIDLMERAAGKVVNELRNIPYLLDSYKRGLATIYVYCGAGNNGGDGFVIARQLMKIGCKVKPYLVKFAPSNTQDCQQNIDRLVEMKVEVEEVHDQEQFPTFNPDDLVVDAIFGSGLSRPVTGTTKQLINHINAALCKVVSVDIPSGLFADDNKGNDFGAIVKADITYSFQFPKRAFLFPQYGDYVGSWKTLDIGLHKEAIQKTETDTFFVDDLFVKDWMPPRPKFSHKGTYGHALLVGGSKGKVGAIAMAAKGCLRAGVGLVTAEVPKCGVTILQTALPEAMVTENDGVNHLQPAIVLSNQTAVGFGPGAGIENETANALKLLIQNTQVPLVIDADGLNLLAENKTWLSFLPPHTILTPHPGEFERLVGKWNSDEEKIEMLKAFCHKHQVITILKGAYSVTCTPSGNLYFNSTGNPGMATGGSGDILLGMITALRAQGFEAIKAAIYGVFIHGKAGDLAAEKKGEVSMVATDILEHLKIA